jgi:stringent starvation protein B
VEFLARFSGRRTTLLIAAATMLAIAAAAAGLADSFWPVLLMLLLVNAAQSGDQQITECADDQDERAEQERSTAAGAVSDYPCGNLEQHQADSERGVDDEDLENVQFSSTELRAPDRRTRPQRQVLSNRS